MGEISPLGFFGCVAITFAIQSLFGPWKKAHGVGFGIAHLSILFIGGFAGFWIYFSWDGIQRFISVQTSCLISVAATGVVVSLLARNFVHARNTWNKE